MKPRFASPADALALQLDDLRALRESVAAACDLHSRETSIASHERASSLLARVRASLLRQNTEGDTVRGSLQLSPGLAAAAEPPASVLFADFLLRLRKTERAPILRDLSTLLNLVASDLTILHSDALALKETDAARVALDQLCEVTPFVMELSQLLPGAAVADLAACCVVADPLAADLAQANVLDAWHNDPATLRR